MPSQHHAASHVIVRPTFDAIALVAAYPPRFTHPNQKLVHGLACPSGTAPRGTLGYARFRAMPLPTPAARQLLGKTFGRP